MMSASSITGYSTLLASKPTVEIALYGSMLITPLIFLMMPVRKALVTAYCAMWMFLPIAKIKLPMIPDLSKPAVISFGVSIALVLFYVDHLVKKYQFKLIDVPVVVFGLLMPFLSCMMNGQSIELALNEMIEAMFLWVVPYFAGRIILGDEMGVETLANGLFFAALLYTPLMWFEMLMSPQLHNWTYGWHQHEFQQTKRGWSYRPMVFMNHGLMTSMWLAAGSVCGVWLFVNKRLGWVEQLGRRYGFVKAAKWSVIFLVFTTTVSNSVGSVLLMMLGIGALFVGRKLGPGFVLVPLIVLSPIYMVTRATGTVATPDLVSLVQPLSDARAASLRFRLTSEDAYVVQGMTKPVFGHGGDGSHRPRDPVTGRKFVADGLWIITLGKMGLIGLISMILSLLLVPTIILFKHGQRLWNNPRFAPTAALTVLMCIYMIDNLLNAMINPIYMLALGALATFATQPLGKKLSAPRPRRPAPPRPADLARPIDQPSEPVPHATFSRL